MSGPGSVPILVYRAKYLKTDKSVHLKSGHFGEKLLDLFTVFHTVIQLATGKQCCSTLYVDSHNGQQFYEFPQNVFPQNVWSLSHPSHFMTKHITCPMR